MDKSTTPQSEADQIAAISEALRMQELDAVEREQELENLKLEVRQMRTSKQEAVAKAEIPVHNPEDEENTFVFNGQSYQFVYPAIRVNGRKLTASMAIRRKDVLERLVRTGSSAIKLIENE